MAKKKDPSKGSGLALVLMRNDFYRDSYKKALLALLFVLSVDVMLIVSIVYLYFNPPKPQYFPVSRTYQMIKWHPLSDPIFDNNYVLQWLSRSLEDSFSLDFIHWRHQLQRASDNFTANGWNWFLEAFKQSGNLKSIVDLKMVSNVTITGAPEVLYQGVLSGTYIWKVEIPLMISYTNMKRTITQPLKVIVIVSRVPVATNPQRIAINQFLPLVQGQQL